MSKTVILSTVFETFYEEHPHGEAEPRVRIVMSDGTIAKYAKNFKNWKILYSGSTILSIVENDETIAIARVEKLKNDKPTKIKEALGDINLSKISTIIDRRAPDMKGDPIDQIPQPYKLTL